MRVGLNVPQDVGSETGRASVARFCRDAEALGFASLWVSESHRPGVLEPLTLLTHAAAATGRVRLGTAVLLSAFRTPRELAATVASIDRLSGGRLDLGVGLGNDPGEYARRGVTPGHRGRHFSAHVRALRKLLEEPRVDDDGPWWSLSGVERQVEPSQEPGPPVLIGASRGPALRRAVDIADGWIGAGSVTPAFFRDALGQVSARLAENNRDRGSFSIRKRVYIHIGTSDEMVRMRAWFGHHYGRPELADDVLVLGSAERCTEALLELSELGVDEAIVHPVVAFSDQAQRLAADVLPRIPDHRGDHHESRSR